MKHFLRKEIKTRTHYFFDNMISTRNLDPNKIKIDKKSYKNILIYYIGYATVKKLRYIKSKSANTLYLIINKI